MVSVSSATTSSKKKKKGGMRRTIVGKAHWMKGLKGILCYKKKKHCKESKAEDLSRTVHMKNLSLLATASDLLEFFKDTGRLEDYHFVYDKKRGRPSRRCFVLFNSEKSAKKALAKDKQAFLERAVDIEKSRVTIDNLRKRKDHTSRICVAPFYNMTWNKVRQNVHGALRKYGRISDVFVDMDRRMGMEDYMFALVRFEDSASALKALKEQTMIRGRHFMHLAA